MKDHEQERREKIEADKRQVDIKNRQLDRFFKEELAICRAACRDGEVKPEE